MITALLWIVVLVLVVGGLLGTVLPVLPGVPLIFGGLLLGAWIDDFSRVQPLTLVLLGVLTVGAVVIDFVAAALGAKRVQASGLAVLGAAIGTIVGIFFGFVGILIFPFLGAALGQFVSEPDLLRAGHVGIATWVGFICGVLIKVAVAFIMLGIFILAYFFG